MAISRIQGILAAGLWVVLQTMAPGAEPGENWRYEIVPSLWVAGLSGQATLAGREIDYDRSTGDLLEHLEAGASLAGKVMHGPYVLGGQIDGYRLTTDALTVDGEDLDARMDTDLVFAELAAGYAIPGWKPGQTFTVAAGVRYAHLDSDLTIGDDMSLSRNHDLWDPILILWPTLPLFPAKITGLSLAPAFSIGGGGDSKLVFELYPQLRYQASEHMVVRFGYRAVAYKVDEDGRDLEDLQYTLAGFIAGLGVDF